MAHTMVCPAITLHNNGMFTNYNKNIVLLSRKSLEFSRGHNLAHA